MHPLSSHLILHVLFHVSTTSMSSFNSHITKPRYHFREAKPATVSFRIRRFLKSIIRADISVKGFVTDKRYSLHQRTMMFKPVSLAFAALCACFAIFPSLPLAMSRPVVEDEANEEVSSLLRGTCIQVYALILCPARSEYVRFY